MSLSGVFCDFFFWSLSISLYFVLLSPPSLPFLSPQIRLFFCYLYPLSHRLVLAFSLKLHIRLFNFFSTVFFCNHSQTHISAFSFLFIWIRTQPYFFFLATYLHQIHPTLHISGPFHCYFNFFFKFNTFFLALAFYSFFSYIHNSL